MLLAFRKRKRGIRVSTMLVETYVGNGVAALDVAGGADIGGIAADMRAPFHARCGGEGEGNGEESRDAGEHGWREESWKSIRGSETGGIYGVDGEPVDLKRK